MGRSYFTLTWNKRKRNQASSCMCDKRKGPSQSFWKRTLFLEHFRASSLPEALWQVMGNACFIDCPLAPPSAGTKPLPWFLPRAKDSFYWCFATCSLGRWALALAGEVPQAAVAVKEKNSTWPGLCEPLHRAVPLVPSVPPGPATRGSLQTQRSCQNLFVFNQAAPADTRLAVHFYVFQIKMLKNKVVYDSQWKSAFTSP